MSDSAINATFPDLAGRIAFVSGGATGIGAQIVRALAAQSMQVVFVDIQVSAGEALSAELTTEQTPCQFIACDITDTKALEAAIDAAEALGPLDVLINNAANDRRVLTSDVSTTEWQSLVDVNLTHQFFAAKRAFKHMGPRGRGSIVNFGSVAPALKIDDLAVYSTCKAAVTGLTRSLAKEMGPSNIRVNAIIPGAVFTQKQIELWYPDESSMNALIAKQCLPLKLGPDNIAAMVLFLASDISSGCTASEFTVDAGIA